MHAIMKRYDLGAGSRGAGALDELARRCHEELVPRIAEIDGVRAYYVVDGGNGVLATVCICEREAATAEADETAKAYFKERLSGMLQANPQVVSGPILVRGP